MANKAARQPLTGNAQTNSPGRGSVPYLVGIEEQPPSSTNITSPRLLGLEATPGSQLHHNQGVYPGYRLSHTTTPSFTNRPATESSRVLDETNTFPTEVPDILSPTDLVRTARRGMGEDPWLKSRLGGDVWHPGTDYPFGSEDVDGKDDYTQRQGTLLANSEPYLPSGSSKGTLNGTVNGFNNGLGDSLNNGNTHITNQSQRQDGVADLNTRNHPQLGNGYAFGPSLGHFPHLSDASNSTQNQSSWNEGGSVRSPSDDRDPYNPFSHTSSRNNSLPPSRQGASVSGSSLFVAAAQSEPQPLLPYAAASRDSNQAVQILPGTRNPPFLNFGKMVREANVAATRDLEHLHRPSCKDPAIVGAKLRDSLLPRTAGNNANVNGMSHEHSTSGAFASRYHVQSSEGHTPQTLSAYDRGDLAFTNSNNVNANFNPLIAQTLARPHGQVALSYGRETVSSSDGTRNIYALNSFPAFTRRNGASDQHHQNSPPNGLNNRVNIGSHTYDPDGTGADTSIGANFFRQPLWLSKTTPSYPSGYTDAGLSQQQHSRQMYSELINAHYAQSFNHLVGPYQNDLWARQAALLTQYNYIPELADPIGLAPTRPEKLQSALLTQFHAVGMPRPAHVHSKNTRNVCRNGSPWTLSDIAGHVAEFTGDQRASRWIQDQLRTATAAEKERLCDELRVSGFYSIMNDSFGNYVMQRLIEFGTQEVKAQIAAALKGHVLEMSTAHFGTRVLQQVIQYSKTEQQIAIVNELKGWIEEVVQDENGNHVLQIVIRHVPGEHIQFIYDAFIGKVGALSFQQYGCRIVQRMLEFGSDAVKRTMLAELREAKGLAMDQYGNYVVQYMLEHGFPEDRDMIIAAIRQDLMAHCVEKFSSNVVEKCFAFGGDQVKHDMMMQLVGGTGKHRPHCTSDLETLCRDQFGNYVVQRMFHDLPDADYLHLYDLIVPIIQKLERYGQSSRSIQNVKLEMLRRHVLLRQNRKLIFWPVPPPEAFRAADVAREQKEKGNKGENNYRSQSSCRPSARQSISRSSGGSHSRKGSLNSSFNTSAAASRSGSGRTSPKYALGGETRGPIHRAPIPKAKSNGAVPPLKIPKGLVSAGPSSGSSTRSGHGLTDEYGHGRSPTDGLAATSVASTWQSPGTAQRSSNGIAAPGTGVKASAFR